MRSLILSLVLGVASVAGLLTISPSQAEAQRFWRRSNRPYYSSYYYPGYTYSYGYVAPSYYYGSYPTYGYTYSSPTYGSYYTPWSSSYYTPWSSSYYTPGYYGSYWRY